MKPDAKARFVGGGAGTPAPSRIEAARPGAGSHQQADGDGERELALDEGRERQPQAISTAPPNSDPAGP